MPTRWRRSTRRRRAPWGGAVDVRGVEAGGRAPCALLPRRVRTSDGLRPAVQRLRAWPDRRRRDPRLHRDGPRGDDLVIHGDGSQIRAWCYVDDMVDGLMLVLERPEAVGQVFNVGNPRSVVTVFDLAVRIRRLMEADVDITHRPLHYTDVEMRIPNIDKARKLLGWEPRSTSTRASPARSRGIESASRRRRDPSRLAGSRRRGAGGGRGGLQERPADHGPSGRGVRGALASACEVEHAVVVSSGTAALHLAVLALGIGPGDEVIVPAYTFPATANVVALAGARPVLVDVDPETMNVTAETVAAGLSPRTKAVLVVHLFGRPAPWEELEAAVPDGVALLEDAAGAGSAAAGTRVRRPRAARLPLLPPAQDRHDRRGRCGHHERSRDRRRDPPLPPPRHRAARRLRDPRGGPELPLPDILCAIGTTQMHRLGVARRARAPGRRVRGAARLCGRAPVSRRGDRHGWQAYVVRTDGRDEALEALAAAGIQAQIGTYALHRLAAYADQGPSRRGRGVRAGARAAFHNRLAEADLDRVAEVLTELVSE